ncbi:hypothetical protein K3495_g2699 [Podosphaera aphanis]|nr:hypothetical protein K3495_g2699 [Podosphaera aphanis]
MSTRQLRRLQKQRERETAKDSDNDEEEIYEPPSPRKHKPSLFANLASLNDEVDDNESEDTDKSTKEHVQPKTESVSVATKPKKSKKKSKAVKKSDKNTIKRIGEDDIERALKELRIKVPVVSGSQKPCASHVNATHEQICAMMSAQEKHLKVGNEMRNLFGKTAVMKTEDTEGPREARRGPLQDQQLDLETALRGHHAPGKGFSEVVLRRNYFILGKDHWPKGPAGRMTMEIVDDQRPDGAIEFRFEHSQIYQETQLTFYHNVENGDPESLIKQLIENPGHISLLIQVSKIAKNQGDHSLSSDLLERALFYFGRAATSYFNTKLSQGKARLNFARPENRELWLAGYHYIRSLMMKGTYRTALEWAKLLFSLNMEDDPYCMKLMIHNLALRANESKWLLDLYETEFYSQRVKSLDQSMISHTTPSLVLAALRLQDHSKVRILLKCSMEQIPWLFSRLCSSLDLEAPPSIWGSEPRSKSESIFTELYVSQTRDLWNTPEATSLLMEIGHTISKVNSSEEMNSHDPVSLDVARFVYLDNTREIMSLVPRELLHRINNSDSDPLPPDTNLFSYEAQQLANQEFTRSIVDLEEQFQPVSTLLRVLNNLPDFGRHALEQVLVHVSAGNNENQDEDEREQQSSIISFTRGLLSHYRRPSNQAGNESDEDAEAEAEQEISNMIAPDREASGDGPEPQNTTSLHGETPDEGTEPAVSSVPEIEASEELMESQDTDVPGFLVPTLVHLSCMIMGLRPEDLSDNDGEPS